MGLLWEIPATGVFLAAAAALVLRWLAQCGLPLPGPFSHPLPRREGETPDKRLLLCIFLGALLFRLIYVLVTLVFYNIISGAGVGPDGLEGLWTRWDAINYIKLSELGYAGHMENGEHLFLVFYPLYVWIIRAFRMVIPNTAMAAWLVSALCYAGGCIYFFRLIAEEYGVRTGALTLVLLSAFPYGFFFGAMMNESLFFLTTAAGLYHIRKHQWGRYALWGILGVLTRMQGLILIGAAIAELCVWAKPLDKQGRARLGALGKIGSRLPVMLLPLLGSLIYLGLNYRVTGDPFAFIQMEKHWSQGWMWFPKVLAYLGRHAVSWPDVTVRWELWVPELVLFPVFALLLRKSWKKHSSTYTLYAFVYFILTYCLSWLLSAGRYLSCDVPCFLFAADELKDRPKLFAGVTIVMGALQLVLLYRYFRWGQIM